MGIGPIWGITSLTFIFSSSSLGLGHTHRNVMRLIYKMPRRLKLICRLSCQYTERGTGSCKNCWLETMGNIHHYHLGFCDFMYRFLRAAACKNRELHFSDHLIGRISDISSEDTLG